MTIWNKLVIFDFSDLIILADKTKIKLGYLH
jgi:hypothetical protein